MTRVTAASVELLEGILSRAKSQEIGLMVETDEPGQLLRDMIKYIGNKPEYSGMIVREYPGAVGVRKKPEALE